MVSKDSRTERGLRLAELLAAVSLATDLAHDAPPGLSLNMSASDFEFRKAAEPVPPYLVLEPHLPEPVASSIRKALLG